MKEDTLDKRFALVGHDGKLRYPYKKTRKVPEAYGFALSAKGKQDRDGGSTYTLDIEEVIRKVVLDGWKVRAKPAKGDGPQQGNSVAIERGAIKGYWVEESLLPIVANAKIRPLELGKGTQPTNTPVLVDHQSTGNVSADDRNESELGKLQAVTDREGHQIDSDYSNKPGEDVDAIVKRRVGQGPFRSLLIAKYGCECSVSGVGNNSLLIASHIVPWSESTADQKTDPDNGLLLSVTWDALFDKGFVSFDDNGNLMRSKRLDDDTVSRLGVTTEVNLPGKWLTEGRKKNLAKHREKFEFSNSKP